MTRQSSVGIIKRYSIR